MRCIFRAHLFDMWPCLCILVIRGRSGLLLSELLILGTCIKCWTGVDWEIQGVGYGWMDRTRTDSGIAGGQRSLALII
jgi:hypothetical protein